MSGTTDRFNGYVASLAFKVPCVVATTANITLNGTQTIEGFALESNDRVLVTSQTDPIENGIWKVTSSDWVREPDFDGRRDATTNSLVVAGRLSPAAPAIYSIDTATPFIIGEDAIAISVYLDPDAAGGGGDDQTPWLSNIDGAGFDLHDVGELGLESPDTTTDVLINVLDAGQVDITSTGIPTALFGVQWRWLDSSFNSIYDQDTFTTNSPPAASTDKYWVMWNINSQGGDNLFNVGFKGQADAPMHFKNYVHGSVIEIQGENDAGTEIDMLVLDPQGLTADFSTLAVTGTTFNGVALTDAGVSTNFLDETGAYSTPAGGGNVSNSGTPVDDQVAVWVSATAIEGTTAFTFDGTAVHNTGGDFIAEGSSARYMFRETGATADEGNWILLAEGDQLKYQLANDASPHVAVTTCFTMTRSGTTPAIVQFQNLSSGVRIQDGANLRIQDAGDVAWVAFSHDATDFNAAFTGTTDWNITGITSIQAGTVDADFDAVTGTDFNGVALTTGGAATNYLDETGNYSVPAGGGSQTPWTSDIDGAGFGLDNIDRLEIQAPGIPGDNVTLSHDGTDFNLASANTNDWLFTGASGGYNFDRVVEIHRVTGAATDILWMRATTDTNDLVWRYDGDWWEIRSEAGAAGTKWMGFNTGQRVDFYGAVRILDSGETDYADFSHDGTDFDTAFTNTADWDITGLTGAVRLLAGTGLGIFKSDNSVSVTQQITANDDLEFNSVSAVDAAFTSFSGSLELRDGMALRIQDAGDTDWATFSHDSTDFNTVFTNTAIWNITGADEYNFDNHLLIDRATGNSEVDINAGAAAADDRRWSIVTSSAGLFSISAKTDAGAATAALSIFRASGVPTSIRIFYPTYIRNGSGLRIFDSGNTNYLNIGHDGTDINFTHNATTDWNISGITSIQAGTVDADFDALTGTTFNGVALTTGGVSTNFLDETGAYSTPAGGGNVSNTGTPVDNQIAVWTSSTVIEGTTALTYDGTAVHNTGGDFIAEGAAARIMLRETGATADEGNWILVADGDQYKVQLANDASPGAAATTTFTMSRSGTTPSLITFQNLSSGVRIQDGANFRIYNTDDTDWMQFQHDGTDFNMVGTNTAKLSITGITSLDVVNYEFDVDQTVGAGQDDYVLTYDNSSGLISLEAAAGGGSPGGSDHYVQFNDNSAFGGDANFQYDGATVLIDDAAVLSLGTTTGDRIQVFGSSYTIGIEASTLYLNTSAVFDFYIGGTGGTPELTIDGTDSTFQGNILLAAGGVTLQGSGQIVTADIHLGGDNDGDGFWLETQDTYGMYLSDQSNATYGGRMIGDTTSDLNTYFSTDNGTNRGFVFKTNGVGNAAADMQFAIHSDGLRSRQPLYMLEAAAALGDTATLGQWWVRNDAPNTPMFTDDDGNDHVLNEDVGGTQVTWTTGNGGTFESGSSQVFESGSILEIEESSAMADPAAGFGRIWVRDDIPNVLVFTDDDGDDTVLGAGGGSPTSLSAGTITATTYGITSDGSADDIVLPEATTSVAGLLGAAKWDEIVANTAKTSNATHTGDVTGDVALTIAAKAVDVAMLADGTDGELITWDASGVAATVGVGTVGQILTSGGAGVAPTFETLGGFDETIIILTDITTPTPPVSQSVQGRYEIWDNDETDPLASFGFEGNNMLRIRNRMHGGRVALQSENSVGTQQFGVITGGGGSTDIYHNGIVRITTDQTGAATIRSDGNTTTEDRMLKFEYANGAWVGFVGYDGSDDLELRNYFDDGKLILSARDSGSADQTLLTMDPTALTAAFTGIAVTATTFNGVALTDGGAATNYLDETGSYSVPPGGSATALSTGTVTATTYGITSDGGADDVVLVEATTSVAGLLGADKWDEIVANTAKTSNATHTGDVTGDVALTIADKAVHVAMLDDGTDGELITWDASGVAATVPVGTVDHVLTSGGTGVAPTFQALPTTITQVSTVILEGTATSSQDIFDTTPTPVDIQWDATTEDTGEITGFDDGEADIVITNAGQIRIHASIVVSNGTINNRTIYRWEIRHRNTGDTEQYIYYMGAQYLRDDTANYDTFALGGQMELNVAAGDKLTVRTVLMDWDQVATGTQAIDTTLSTVRVEKITYTLT